MYRPSTAAHVAGADWLGNESRLEEQSRKPSAPPAEPGQAGMRWSSPTELLVRLAMAEGLLTDAWMIVNAHGCSEGLLGQLAEASEQSHPAEALKAYADRVERMVGLGGQSNYENAHRIIGRMRLIREGLGEIMQHAAYLDDLRSRHMAKRNFMKLLTAGEA
jgi:hypothetical protein